MKIAILLFTALTAVTVSAALLLEKTIDHVSMPLEMGSDEEHNLYGPSSGVYGLQLAGLLGKARAVNGVQTGRPDQHRERKRPQHLPASARRFLNRKGFVCGETLAVSPVFTQTESTVKEGIYHD